MGTETIEFIESTIQSIAVGFLVGFLLLLLFPATLAVIEWRKRRAKRPKKEKEAKFNDYETPGGTVKISKPEILTFEDRKVIKLSGKYAGEKTNLTFQLTEAVRPGRMYVGKSTSYDEALKGQTLTVRNVYCATETLAQYLVLRKREKEKESWEEEAITEEFDTLFTDSVDLPKKAEGKKDKLHKVYEELLSEDKLFLYQEVDNYMENGKPKLTSKRKDLTFDEFRELVTVIQTLYALSKEEALQVLQETKITFHNQGGMSTTESIFVPIIRLEYTSELRDEFPSLAEIKENVFRMRRRVEIESKKSPIFSVYKTITERSPVYERFSNSHD